MFPIALLLYLSLAPCSLALSWPRKISQYPFGPATTATSADPVTESEISTLFLTQGTPYQTPVLHEYIVNTWCIIADSLESYSRRPDCFKKAAGVIRTHCGQLDMDEGERINAAISMTLCELATATHHSTPFECVAFSLDPILHQQAPNPRSQGECVDALSRSAQSWSSYSGYLREVPQLCFAFRRWNDIDTARDIYKNATLEKAALLRFLISREKDTEKFIRGWESRLMEFQEAVLQLQSASSGISITNAQTRSRLETDIADTLTLIRDVHLRQNEHASHHAAQAEAALERVSQDHAHKLSSQLSSFEALVIRHVDSIFSHSLADNEASRSLTSQIQERWKHFGSEISSLSQSVILLSSTSSEAARIFDDSFQQAHVLRDVQRETSESAAQLVDTISRLTTTTHAELERINSTAAFIHQTLLLKDYGPLQWLCTALTNTIQFILRVDPVSLSFLDDLPLYRIILAVLTLLGYLLRTTFSGVVTMCLAVFSARRYMSKYAKNPFQATSRTLVSPLLPHTHKYRVYPSSLQAHRFHQRRSFGLGVSRIPDRLMAPY